MVLELTDTVAVACGKIQRNIAVIYLFMLELIQQLRIGRKVV